MGEKKRSRKRAERALRERRIPRDRLQYGALCYRRTKRGVRVLLVTSRRTKRWISPKGWPMKRKDPSQAAAQEAWEEAGVRGTTSDKALGFYTYQKYLSRKKSITCLVQVFPLEVERRLEDYPERDQRRRQWMKPSKAAKRVREPELAELIRKIGDQKREAST